MISVKNLKKSFNGVEVLKGIDTEIEKGDVVCIIESMKLMNEINCEFSGKVAEIYVNNGDAVEYGQKIMRIE